MDRAVRQQLVNLMLVRQAHLSFEDAIKEFPAEHYNTRPPNVDYTFWALLDHIRYCQWDILDYITNPHYKAAKWPRDYWPNPEATVDATGWEQTIREFYADRDKLVEIIKDPDTDLYAPIPHASNPSHNIMREVLVVADHNAYHIGEFAILRQVMGLWGEPPG